MAQKRNRWFFPIIGVFFLTVGCLGCVRGVRMDLGIPQERAKAVDAYLAEFSSGSFMDSKIGPAIREVMMRLPQEALTKVMDRRRPVL
ncbi:MAG: hypothetical protein HQL21_07270, partial [Candidatus Omnitrophica bacterium]|nr:hypothetical protein [Candidatus Omnitrophota bacterium]